MSDEDKDGLQFDQAEFEPGQAGSPSACAICDEPLEGSYYTLNGHPSCAACKTGFEARFTGGSGLARLGKSVIFGVLGGLIGALLYYGVAKITGYELSLIAIATGWLTGKGVSMGNGHRGGRLYQLLAVLLTWGAISASYVPFIDEGMREELDQPTQEESYANEAAALGETTEPGEAAEPSEAAESDEAIEAGELPQTTAETDEGFYDLPTPLRWALLYALAIILPFLAITESPMVLLILLIGLWTAWGTNKKVQLHVSGPHALQTPPPPAPGGAAEGPADPLPPSA